jgi:hypothetical protein
MTEEELETCMDWHGGSDPRENEGYPVKLTIGEMNLLSRAVSEYKDKEISKWDETSKDYNSAYGYSEENCNEILSKVKYVQLDIFKAMGEERIRYTQDHKNIDGTIQ